jgi:predicted extracellular nuclease
LSETSRTPGRAFKIGRVAAAAVLPAALLAVLPATAHAASADVVISQVYGGGGNSGAVLTNDFIELANTGTAAFDLSGYSVQYISAAPTATSKWSVTALSGSIPAGGKFLVQESAGTGGTTALPAADTTGTIAMSGTSGTVALVNGGTALSCKTAADCGADSTIKDLVGYGTAVVNETADAPTLSNTTADARNSALADTDDNSRDFTAGLPSPTNSAGTNITVTDGGGTSTGGGGTPGDLRIHDIQGTSWVSPYADQSVSAVPGVVTAVRSTGSKGFFLQDPTPDDNAATSEGIYVYTGSATPTVAVGDSLLVSGKVSEYYPGGASTGILPTTEITSPKISKLSSGNAVPAAVAIDASTFPDAYAADASGASILGTALDPGKYALDWQKAHADMLVSVTDTRVVGPTDAFGEVYVQTKPTQNPTKRGGTIYKGYDDHNSGILEIVGTGVTTPVANVGDVLTGTTTGPLDFGTYGGFQIAATSIGSRTDNGLTQEKAVKARPDELSVATYNVENLAPGNADSKFARLAAGIVTNLSSPDIVSLEEIQDNDGATDDGVVAADQTLDKFVAAIVAAGGPKYEWREIDPVNDADGGQPGGNIRTAFLFNPSRVDFVDRAGGGSTTAVSVVTEKNHKVHLSVSPGRIDPANPAWDDSRKPLAGEFVFHGKQVFVIGNHFDSKGGDQPFYAQYQPPGRSSEVQRLKQAATENAWLKSLYAADPRANVVVLGDLNDFQFSPAVTTLTDNGKTLTDLINTLPANERYSYVYQGNSEVLDHILVSPAIRGFSYDVVHINAEFADQTSDHDPQVVRVRFGCDGWDNVWNRPWPALCRPDHR